MNDEQLPPPVGRRERMRESTRDEARRIALRQLETGGAGGISLKAVASEMGMTGPALFRYFANRDVLITDLVIDAYRELGDVLWVDLERTEGEVRDERNRSQMYAYRSWAIANPHRYLLIFGTPVPGYTAPAALTVPLAQRVMGASFALLAEYVPLGESIPATEQERALEAWARKQGIEGFPGVLIRHAIVGWTRLHGLISLELEGHFASGLPDPKILFEAEVESMIEELGRYSTLQ